MDMTGLYVLLGGPLLMAGVVTALDLLACRHDRQKRRAGQHCS